MKNNNGFISLHRKFLDWEWYSDINTARVFLHCLLNANYTDGKFMGKVIPRGSFVTSLKNLSDETGLSLKKTRVAIKHLKTTNELAIKTTNKFSVISVVKYDVYQDVNFEKGTQNGTQKGKQRANKGQQYNNINKEININNNYGETSSPEKEPIKKFIPPSLDEVKLYCLERKNGINPDMFLNYYESRGWMIGKNKMKDWKACIRTWEQRQKPSSSFLDLLEE